MTSFNLSNACMCVHTLEAVNLGIPYSDFSCRLCESWDSLWSRNSHFSFFFATASAQSLAQEWLNSHARTSKKYSLSQAYITLESSQKLVKE